MPTGNHYTLHSVAMVANISTINNISPKTAELGLFRCQDIQISATGYDIRVKRELWYLVCFVEDNLPRGTIEPIKI